jgi:hypothetical protein
MTPGQLVIISTGEYSGYSLEGLFKVLVPFEFEAKKVEFLNKFPEFADSYEALERFLPWLHSEGLIEDYPYCEWHLGSYSTISPTEYKKHE